VGQGSRRFPRFHGCSMTWHDSCTWVEVVFVRQYSILCEIKHGFSLAEEDLAAPVDAVHHVPFIRHRHGLSTSASPRTSTTSELHLCQISPSYPSYCAHVSARNCMNSSKRVIVQRAFRLATRLLSRYAPVSPIPKKQS
jgi:hypothetical protein